MRVSDIVMCFNTSHMSFHRVKDAASVDKLTYHVKMPTDEQ